MTRQLIVVDIESSGLGPSATVLEIAAINVVTGEELRMVPFVTSMQLSAADPEALRINRYFERAVFRDMLESPEMTTSCYKDFLVPMLENNTLAGSNPTFDATHLAKHTGEVWHHRLADLAAYAAGILGLDPTELPGLDQVCALLKVDIEERHSALGDARATAECFRRLRAMGFKEDSP